MLTVNTMRHRHWQVVSLLYDDGRESRFPGGSLGCDLSSCRYCTTLQLEVLAACATLRRMCAEGPVWRVAVLEALRAAPRALWLRWRQHATAGSVGPCGHTPAPTRAATKSATCRAAWCSACPGPLG